MRVFALGDPHLSHAKPKPMHIFGEQWRNHAQKIAQNWATMAQPDDVLIIAGDISWAMRLEEAQADLDYLAQLVGTKVLIRGNHDYWWASKAKLSQVADPSLIFLQADAIIRQGIAIVGTRGWQCPGNQSAVDLLAEMPQLSYTAEDEKIYLREVARLKRAMESLKGQDYQQIIVVLHYPPMNDQHEASGFTDILDQYKVANCVYGHLHGAAISTAFNGLRKNTHYQLVSADSINFTPQQIV